MASVVTGVSTGVNFQVTTTSSKLLHSMYFVYIEVTTINVLNYDYFSSVLGYYNLM